MIVPEKVYSVTTINNYVKSLLNNNTHLQLIYVKGEISNFKKGANGHIYFSLKDKECTISCAMFANNAYKLGFVPNNGDEVIVYASLDAYPARGTYQLVIYEMVENGRGQILIELEQLKKKLLLEGLFDESRKRPLKKYPQKIGIITAKNSAAIKDMIENINRRYPLVDIYVFYSAVQGENAPKELLEAFYKSQEYPLDALIIGRGGGASEDLNAFNDETLVRAISTSKMPVIAAIGHEIDRTIIDYVADKYASTPTGAAEAVVPDQKDIIRRFEDTKESMQTFIKHQLERTKEDVSSYKEELLEEVKESINNLKLNLNAKKEKLEALNPKNILKRGYSLTINEEGVPLKSIKNVKTGDKIITILDDGQVVSQVEDKKE